MPPGMPAGLGGIMQNPAFANMMSNPAMMEMAKNMMSNPAMMSNLMGMMGGGGGGGGMPDLSALAGMMGGMGDGGGEDGGDLDDMPDLISGDESYAPAPAPARAPPAASKGPVVAHPDSDSDDAPAPSGGGMPDLGGSDAPDLSALLSDPEFAEMRNDPEVAAIMAEASTGGPSAVLKHMGNPKMQKLVSAAIAKLKR